MSLAELQLTQSATRQPAATHPTTHRSLTHPLTHSLVRSSSSEPSCWSHYYSERKAEFVDAAAAQAAVDELRLADGDCCCTAMRLLRRTSELLQERVRLDALMQGQWADE